jgi:hypothetical protein
MSIIWNPASSSATLPDNWVKINNLGDLTSAIATYGNNPAVFLFAPVTIDCTTEGLIDFGDNKYILGVGADTTILQNQTTTGTNPNFRFGDRNVVQNMTFDYKSVTGTTETQPLCYINANCSFQNVQFQGIASGTYELVRIDSSAVRVTFQDCIFANVASSGKGVVMVDHDGQVVKFVNCYFESFGTGTQVLENGASTGSVLVNNCYFTTCLSSGLMWDFANNYFALSNCFFRDCTKDVTLASTVGFLSYGNLYEGSSVVVESNNVVFNIVHSASARNPTTLVTSNTNPSSSAWVKIATSGSPAVVGGGNTTYTAISTTTNPTLTFNADSPPALVYTSTLFLSESPGGFFGLIWYDTNVADPPANTVPYQSGSVGAGLGGDKYSSIGWSFKHPGGSAVYALYIAQSSAANVTYGAHNLQMTITFD